MFIVLWVIHIISLEKCVHVKAPLTLAMELVSNANIIKVHFGLEGNAFVRYWKLLLYFEANEEKKLEWQKMKESIWNLVTHEDYVKQVFYIITYYISISDKVFNFWNCDIFILKIVWEFACIGRDEL